MKFVCVSDTHTMHDRLPIPEGDVLIHAGDMTNVGSLEDVARFNGFLKSLRHRYKIVIAGNHDFAFQNSHQVAKSMLTDCIYLEDSETAIEGIRIYGSPWQPEFMNWAFNLERGAALKAKWDRIPDDTDILLTHGPPLGHGDAVPAYGSTERVGCADLLAAVERIKPKYHIFGHIHEGYGITKNAHTTFINASMCDGAYNPMNPPIVFDWDRTDIASGR